MIEVPRHAIELADQVVANRRGDEQVMAGEVQIHQTLLVVLRASRRARQIALRRLTGGIISASRYLAMVRRATTMPWSPRSSAMALSVSGVFGVSAPISWRISARIAVAEHAPPVSVAT